MKVTQASPVFRMRFCHVRLPIYKKSGVARSLMQWYRLRLYEHHIAKGKKQDLTPHWCILIG